MTTPRPRAQRPAKRATSTTRTTTAGPLVLGAGVDVVASWAEADPGALDLAPDGAHVAHVGARTIRCRDAVSGDERWAQSALAGSPTALRYSPDGARIAVSSLHGHIAILDAATGAILGEHRVDMSPRGRLAWAPGGARVLSTHGHAKDAVALVDRDGASLTIVALPQEVGSAAFLDDARVVLTRFQSNVIVFDLDALRLADTFARPTVEMAVAANRTHIALSHGEGHLLLRAHDGGALPDTRTLRAANAPIADERFARNALRIDKMRTASMKHTLAHELEAAKRAWKKSTPPAGWAPWLPLPHGQIQNMRFVDAREPHLLLCDGRDASLVTVASDAVSERLLVGVAPIPGYPPLILDVACRPPGAAVSITSSNPRLPSQILVLRV